MLDKTLPRSDHLPFDAWTAAPMASLLLFVHRVEDLAPGLYFFSRTPEELPAFRRATAPALLWEPVMTGFPLYRLADGSFRRTAMQVSCHQEIAGFGAFSLGMIVRFRETVRRDPWRYRHLFWETGMIGQTLYLEAEAQGVRGTGIGCFFDDAVHDLLGLADDTFQSLYHFTVGNPVEDSRIETLPPYGHLPAAPPE
jgi:nitroreductase